MKSNALNFEIIGVPIGDPIFCARTIAEKRANASMFNFLALLKEVGPVDLDVALLLLCQCGGFCQMVHITRCTPPSVALEGLQLFDEEVRQTFSDLAVASPLNQSIFTDDSGIICSGFRTKETYLQVLRDRLVLHTIGC